MQQREISLVSGLSQTSLMPSPVSQASLVP
jgi:hypothetical protein